MKPRHDQDRPDRREPSELSEAFHRQVTPLPPPPGSFDEIRGRARARRRGRVLWAGIAAAGCVAAGAVALNMTDDSAPSTVAVSPDGTAASRPAAGHTGRTEAGHPEEGSPKAATGAPQEPPPATREQTGSAPPGTHEQAAQAPAICRTADLSITLGAGEGAAGSQYRPLRVTNDADTPCSLFGFPGVSMVDAQGHQLGKPADRDGAQARGRVVMKPGQREQVTLRVIDAGVYSGGTCHVAGAAGIRVYPPGQKASVVVPVKGLRGCTSSDATTLTVTSYGVH
ncbi:hypothetical protein GCM10018793_52480 [Streptomyces sulfonofaciens]|uniref:DUF4232 domain-containing protein n=1 Tax=Streptomyces sulfonofaciens TaxID=68272 RepID=A0A919L618_9ACTN|nr:DUF4232 domain-containing protein [Streptomyces sulfonofaciens]GHH85242.1 hypothetical protein GCM10018793_52480 [Streptomyces sulfonofaciens]